MQSACFFGRFSLACLPGKDYSLYMNFITANAIIQAGHRRDRAREIVASLWSIGEMYHAGAINHETFTARNRRIWDAVEAEGLRTEVSRLLRNAL
jgi:hypothetical protein